MPAKDNMVEVQLDDGDRRQVDIGNVRMLPQDYSKVGRCQATDQLSFCLGLRMSHCLTVVIL